MQVGSELFACDEVHVEVIGEHKIWQSQCDHPTVEQDALGAVWSIQHPFIDRV